MQLLKQYNGDTVVALDVLYKEVQSRHPGYFCCVVPEPDDEFYDAHIEYVTIRKLIHDLVKRAFSNHKYSK